MTLTGFPAGAGGREMRGPLPSSSGDGATRLGYGSPAAATTLAAPLALERLFGDFLHWKPIPPTMPRGPAEISAGICKLRISAGAWRWNAVKHACPIHNIRSYRHSESTQARVEIPAPARFSTT